MLAPPPLGKALTPYSSTTGGILLNVYLLAASFVFGNNVLCSLDWPLILYESEDVP